MLTVNAMVNGKFTPEYAAYTKLALVNRVQNQARGVRSETVTDSMTFKQFMEALQTDTVNQRYARQVTQDEVNNNRVYAQNNGNYPFAEEKFSAIERAYELGLVDRSGVLLSTFFANA